MPRRNFTQRIRTIGLYGLIGLALVVVVAYLNLESEQRKNKLRDRDRNVDLNTAEITFDQIVERSNIDQLIEMSRELSEATDDAMFMRLDRISKQIAISNQILQLDPDRHSRAEAVLIKLEQLMDRAQIIARQEIYSDAATTELNQFAAEYVDSEDVAIASQAKTGIAIASICEFLSTAPSGQRNRMAIDAIERLKAAAGFSPDDLSVATRLHDWLLILREQARQEESRLFFDAWTRVYADSGDNRIANLVDQTENASDLSEVDLVNIFDSVRSDRDVVVGKLLEQVDAALKQQNLSNATVLFIIQRATELLAFGKLEEANQIREKIEQSSINFSSEEIDRALAKLDSKLNLFESPMDISSFTDFDFNLVNFNIAEAKFRILYFVSDLNNGETMPKFTKLIETVRREVMNSNLEVVVVYLERDDDPEGLQKIKLLAVENVRWQVWLLKSASEQGQKFLSRFSIDKSPYIVLLRNDNRPMALDPSVLSIEEFVFGNAAAQD